MKCLCKVLFYLFQLYEVAKGKMNIPFSEHFYFFISGYVWVKVYQHNLAGGFFADAEAARESNPTDPSADLYSILNRVEEFRKDGVFHIRFCWPEVTSGLINDFPCNEWTQSSNFAEEIEIEDFEPIALSFTGYFGGLAVSPPSSCCNLIDATPDSGHWWYSVGTYSSFGRGFPGPHPTSVTQSRIYLSAGKGRVQKLN